jgi:hypothetical protein
MCLNQCVVVWVMMAEADADMPKKLVCQACISSFAAAMVSVDGKKPITPAPSQNQQ